METSPLTAETEVLNQPDPVTIIATAIKEAASNALEQCMETGLLTQEEDPIKHVLRAQQFALLQLVHISDIHCTMDMKLGSAMMVLTTENNPHVPEEAYKQIAETIVEFATPDNSEAKLQA